MKQEMTIILWMERGEERGRTRVERRQGKEREGVEEREGDEGEREGDEGEREGDGGERGTKSKKVNKTVSFIINTNKCTCREGGTLGMLCLPPSECVLVGRGGGGR